MRKAFLIGLATLVLGGLLAAPAGAFQLKLFQTPDQNIGCSLIFGKEASGGGARCDIAEHSWKAPKKPAWCEVDFGQGLSVGAQGEGGFVCAGDTTLQQGRKLGAGKSISLGPYACKNLGTAVRCVNHRTKHGFEISRTVAERF